jgi:hypothetical protein
VRPNGSVPVKDEMRRMDFECIGQISRFSCIQLDKEELIKKDLARTVKVRACGQACARLSIMEKHNTVGDFTKKFFKLGRF